MKDNSQLCFSEFALHQISMAEEDPYVHRHALEEASVNMLEKNNKLVIHGPPQSGKTSVCIEVVKRLSQKRGDWKIAINIGPNIVEDVANHGNFIIFLDEFVGLPSADINTLAKWKKEFPKLSFCIEKKNIYLILCLSANTFRELKHESHLFKLCSDDVAIDISSEKWRLSTEEKYLIASACYKRFVSNINDASSSKTLSDSDFNMIAESNPFNGFLKSCHMFFTNIDIFKRGISYFLSVTSELQKTITKIHANDKLQYLILINLLTKSSCAPEETPLLLERLETLRKALSFEIHISHSKTDEAIVRLKEASLITTKSTTQLELSHEQVRQASFISFSTYFPAVALDVCDSRIIRKYGRPNYNCTDTYVECVCFPPTLMKHFAKRLCQSYDDAVIESIFNDPSCKEPTIVSFILDEISQKCSQTNIQLNDTFEKFSNENRHEIIREILKRCCQSKSCRKFEIEDNSISTYATNAIATDNEQAINIIIETGAIDRVFRLMVMSAVEKGSEKITLRLMNNSKDMITDELIRDIFHRVFVKKIDSILSAVHRKNTEVNGVASTLHLVDSFICDEANVEDMIEKFVFVFKCANDKTSETTVRKVLIRVIQESTTPAESLRRIIPLLETNSFQLSNESVEAIVKDVAFSTSSKIASHEKSKSGNLQFQQFGPNEYDIFLMILKLIQSDVVPLIDNKVSERILTLILRHEQRDVLHNLQNFLLSPKMARLSGQEIQNIVLCHLFRANTSDTLLSTLFESSASSSVAEIDLTVIIPLLLRRSYQHSVEVLLARVNVTEVDLRNIIQESIQTHVEIADIFHMLIKNRKQLPITQNLISTILIYSAKHKEDELINALEGGSVLNLFQPDEKELFLFLQAIIIDSIDHSLFLRQFFRRTDLPILSVEYLHSLIDKICQLKTNFTVAYLRTFIESPIVNEIQNETFCLIIDSAAQRSCFCQSELSFLFSSPKMSQLTDDTMYTLMLSFLSITSFSVRFSLSHLLDSPPILKVSEIVVCKLIQKFSCLPENERHLSNMKILLKHEKSETLQKNNLMATLIKAIQSRLDNRLVMQIIIETSHNQAFQTADISALLEYSLMSGIDYTGIIFQTNETKHMIEITNFFHALHNGVKTLIAEKASISSNDVAHTLSCILGNDSVQIQDRSVRELISLVQCMPMFMCCDSPLQYHIIKAAVPTHNEILLSAMKHVLDQDSFSLPLESTENVCLYGDLLCEGSDEIIKAVFTSKHFASCLESFLEDLLCKFYLTQHWHIPVKSVLSLLSNATVSEVRWSLVICLLKSAVSTDERIRMDRVFSAFAAHVSGTQHDPLSTSLPFLPDFYPVSFPPSRFFCHQSSFIPPSRPLTLPFPAPNPRPPSYPVCHLTDKTNVIKVLEMDKVPILTDAHLSDVIDITSDVSTILEVLCIPKITTITFKNVEKILEQFDACENLVHFLISTHKTTTIPAKIIVHCIASERISVDLLSQILQNSKCRCISKDQIRGKKSLGNSVFPRDNRATDMLLVDEISSFLSRQALHKIRKALVSLSCTHISMAASETLLLLCLTSRNTFLIRIMIQINIFPKMDIEIYSKKIVNCLNQKQLFYGDQQEVIITLLAQVFPSSWPVEISSTLIAISFKESLGSVTRLLKSVYIDQIDCEHFMSNLQQKLEHTDNACELTELLKLLIEKKLTDVSFPILLYQATIKYTFHSDNITYLIFQHINEFDLCKQYDILTRFRRNYTCTDKINLLNLCSTREPLILLLISTILSFETHHVLITDIASEDINSITAIILSLTSRNNGNNEYTLCKSLYETIVLQNRMHCSNTTIKLTFQIHRNRTVLLSFHISIYFAEEIDLTLNIENQYLQNQTLIDEALYMSSFPDDRRFILTSMLKGSDRKKLLSHLAEYKHPEYDEDDEYSKLDDFTFRLVLASQLVHMIPPEYVIQRICEKSESALYTLDPLLWPDDLVPKLTLNSEDSSSSSSQDYNSSWSSGNHQSTKTNITQEDNASISLMSNSVDTHMFSPIRTTIDPVDNTVTILWTSSHGHNQSKDELIRTSSHTEDSEPHCLTIRTIIADVQRVYCTEFIIPEKNYGCKFLEAVIDSGKIRFEDEDVLETTRRVLSGRCKVNMYTTLLQSNIMERLSESVVEKCVRLILIPHKSRLDALSRIDIASKLFQSVYGKNINVDKQQYLCNLVIRYWDVLGGKASTCLQYICDRMSVSKATVEILLTFILTSQQYLCEAFEYIIDTHRELYCGENLLQTVMQTDSNYFLKIQYLIILLGKKDVAISDEQFCTLVALAVCTKPQTDKELKITLCETQPSCQHSSFLFIVISRILTQKMLVRNRIHYKNLDFICTSPLALQTQRKLIILDIHDFPILSIEMTTNRYKIRSMLGNRMQECDIKSICQVMVNFKENLNGLLVFVLHMLPFTVTDHCAKDILTSVVYKTIQSQMAQHDMLSADSMVHFKSPLLLDILKSNGCCDISQESAKELLTLLIQPYFDITDFLDELLSSSRMPLLSQDTVLSLITTCIDTSSVPDGNYIETFLNYMDRSNIHNDFFITALRLTIFSEKKLTHVIQVLERYCMKINNKAVLSLIEELSDAIPKYNKENLYYLLTHFDVPIEKIGFAYLKTIYRRLSSYYEDDLMNISNPSNNVTTEVILLRTLISKSECTEGHDNKTSFVVSCFSASKFIKRDFCYNCTLLYDIRRLRGQCDPFCDFDGDNEPIDLKLNTVVKFEHDCASCNITFEVETDSILVSDELFDIILSDIESSDRADPFLAMVLKSTFPGITFSDDQSELLIRNAIKRKHDRTVYVQRLIKSPLIRLQSETLSKGLITYAAHSTRNNCEIIEELHKFTATHLSDNSFADIVNCIINEGHNRVRSYLTLTLKYKQPLEVEHSKFVQIVCSVMRRTDDSTDILTQVLDKCTVTNLSAVELVRDCLKYKMDGAKEEDTSDTKNTNGSGTNDQAFESDNEVVLYQRCTLDEPQVQNTSDAQGSEIDNEKEDKDDTIDADNQKAAAADCYQTSKYAKEYIRVILHSRFCANLTKDEISELIRTVIISPCMHLVPEILQLIDISILTDTELHDLITLFLESPKKITLPCIKQILHKSDLESTSASRTVFGLVKGLPSSEVKDEILKYLQMEAHV